MAVIGPVEDNYRRGEPINHFVQAPDEAVELPTRHRPWVEIATTDPDATPAKQWS